MILDQNSLRRELRQTLTNKVNTPEWEEDYKKLILNLMDSGISKRKIDKMIIKWAKG